LLRDFHFGVDCLADLNNLGLDEERVSVALGVVLDEDCGRIVVPIAGYEVPRRLRKQAELIRVLVTWSMLSSCEDCYCCITYKTVQI
jgi:hypothetical protein